MNEREQMNDEWLLKQFEAALSVGYMQTPEGQETYLPNVLRGFANRVLQTFGDREGMRDSLDIGFKKYTEEKTALQKCQEECEALRAQLKDKS